MSGHSYLVFRYLAALPDVDTLMNWDILIQNKMNLLFYLMFVFIVTGSINPNHVPQHSVLKLVHRYLNLFLKGTFIF